MAKTGARCAAWASGCGTSKTGASARERPVFPAQPYGSKSQRHQQQHLRPKHLQNGSFVEALLNTRPRKALGYRTPAEVLRE
jgi:hypothetical protein